MKAIGNHEKKEAYKRKNPQAAEAFAEKRRARNSARPKQVWNGTGWVR